MKNNRKFVVWFAGIALLISISVVIVGSFWAYDQIDTATKERKHNYALIIRGNALLSELVDAETGQRGYLLTGDTAFLEPYLLVRDSIGGHLEELRRLSQISAARRHLDAIAPLIISQLSELSYLIELRRSSDIPVVISTISSNQGKRLMDSIRVEMNSFILIQDEALAKHDAELQLSMHQLFGVIVAVCLFMLLLALLFGYVIYLEAQDKIKNSVHIETQRLLDIQEETNKKLQLVNDALKVSEEKLSVTLISIGDAVLVTDAQARVTLLNPIAEQLTGWTQAETVGRSVDDIFKIINETTRQPAIIPIKDALTNGTIQGLANHTILIARSGIEYSIDDSCAPIRDIDGKVVGAVLVFRNITERREIENGLERARKELVVIKQLADEESEFSKSLINTVREPLLSLDQDLRVVTVSRSFYEFFKVKPEETVGQLIYDLGNKQWDIPKLRELLETILPQKSSFENYEVEHDFATIGKRVMLLNARQIQRASGKERIILLAIEDITERKEIENELQKARKELECVVQIQKQEITTTKESLDHETEGRLFEEGEVSHRQEALEAVYAMETAFDSNIESLYNQIVLSIATTLRAPAAVIDEYRDGKIVHGAQCLDGCVSRSTTPEAPCAACRSVLDDKHPRQFRGDLEKQFTGDLCFDPFRFHSYLGVPINGPQGELFGVINVRDDKERTFTDSEIQFIETFGRYIAHELSRRGLESRVRRAEEMRLLGQLTSGVAHEVRNPLNGILAIMGAMSKEFAETAALHEYITHMRSQVTRLKLLMEDLLELARPTREENLQKISLVKLVGNAITTWLQTIQNNPREIRFHQPDDADKYLIKAEIPQITQIIVNLLENANDHSPAEAPIDVWIQESGYSRATLIIKDSGQGIPAELLARIFEPFFTTRKGGTGLGLSIVRHIVENHQGSVIAYNNTEGPGATVEIVLPIVRN